MTPAENILNAARHQPVAGSLGSGFVVRAIKAYAITLRRASLDDIAHQLPDEDARAWQRAARLLLGRLEAASVRGQRLDDAFFCGLIRGPDRDVLRRFVLRALRNYAQHVTAMPRTRVAGAVRGIEAWRWQSTAHAMLNTIETIEAFDARPAR